MTIGVEWCGERDTRNYIPRRTELLCVVSSRRVYSLASPRARARILGWKFYESKSINLTLSVWTQKATGYQRTKLSTREKQKKSWKNLTKQHTIGMREKVILNFFSLYSSQKSFCFCEHLEKLRNEETFRDRQREREEWAKRCQRDYSRENSLWLKIQIPSIFTTVSGSVAKNNGLNFFSAFLLSSERKKNI